MTQPTARPRNLMLLIGGGLAISCLLCSVCGLVIAAADDGSASTSTTSAGRIPTGNTPDQYPGANGWLPSGRGIPIPDADLIDGKPVGLWWFRQANFDVGTELFLEDGTLVRFPRPGGPRLFDRETQASRPNNGIGTFAIENDTITWTVDGFTSSYPYATGNDGEGLWFSHGAARNRPIAIADEAQVLGVWKTPGSQYEFRADGTMTLGVNNELVVGGTAGTWLLDGYLMQIKRDDGSGWISVIGTTSNARFLVIGNKLYTRE